MLRILIISSSVRTERKSQRVALHFKNYLPQNYNVTTEILDLKEYNFPIFEERLRKQEKPSQLVLKFTEKIKSSDGLILVTPEYNGGYPASLKNVIDILYDEWKKKPIGISTVSSTIYGGSQVIMSLQFSLWKIGAWVIPETFSVSKVEKTFDDAGNPTDKIKTKKYVDAFVKELLWCIEARQNTTNIDKYIL